MKTKLKLKLKGKQGQEEEEQRGRWSRRGVTKVKRRTSEAPTLPHLPPPFSH